MGEQEAVTTGSVRGGRAGKTSEDRRKGRWSAAWTLGAAIVLLTMGSTAAVAADPPSPPSPAVLFGPLFADVELKGVFPDSKTFADAIPKRAPVDILADYRPGLSADQLRAFVEQNFTLPGEAAAPPPASGAISLQDHIKSLWPVLTRPPLTPAPYSSQLPLAHTYIVPGGRFREVYYWDSYFTLLGAVKDGRTDLAKGLVADFADLIDTHGHVPNGARTYYLSRSQPPVFFLMTGLLDAGDPAASHARYLHALRKEYRFWMHGEDQAQPGKPVEHVVRLADGTVLNRYWGGLDTPRDESYREDVTLAKTAGRPSEGLYRDVRSAAESGWDFSSRWMADPRSLASLRTTDIVPVDLNSLLFGMERAIADGCAKTADRPCARDFTRRAERRRQAIDRYLWDKGRGIYLDLDWRTGERLDHESAAMLYPAFVGAAPADHVHRLAQALRRDLLAEGGLRTTTARTGQQWDAPNGWAPLQWIAVSGLRRYHEDALASDIATRWIATVCRSYSETGKLLEKYDVEEIRPGGGGEYPLQDGFGWTNGVTRALLADYPAAADNRCTYQASQAVETSR